MLLNACSSSIFSALPVRMLSKTGLFISMVFGLYLAAASSAFPFFSRSPIFPTTLPITREVPPDTTDSVPHA